MGEEKEEKPKKAFVVIHTCWDDGEIDTEMYEFRKNQSGRGAPGKWRLKEKEFVTRLGEVLGDATTIVETMAEQTGIYIDDEKVQALAEASGQVSPGEISKVDAPAKKPRKKKDEVAISDEDIKLVEGDGSKQSEDISDKDMPKDDEDLFT